MLKNVFLGTFGCNITPENSLFQLFFPFLVDLGWVFNREILFPCFTAAPVTVISLKCGNWNILASTGWHQELLLCLFFPKFAFLRWCRWLHRWGKGDLLGYKPEKNVGIGSGNADHWVWMLYPYLYYMFYILKYPIFWNKKLSFHLRLG